MLSRFGALFVPLVLVFLSACAASFHNRGGVTDVWMDRWWWKADSKEMRALRGLSLQASLLRVGLYTHTRDTDRKDIGSKTFSATTKFIPVLQCIWGADAVEKLKATADPSTVTLPPTKACPYFDSLMRDYEEALLALTRSSAASSDQVAAIEALVGGMASPLDAILLVARSAYADYSVLAPLYRDTVELQTLVWRDSDPGMAAIYTENSDAMAAWEAELAVLNASSRMPQVRPQHLKYVTDFMLSMCHQLGPDEYKTNCSQDLVLQLSFESRKAAYQKSMQTL